MLLGRDRECAELERMLARASRGRSAVLVLRGQPGIGKSVLLQEAATRASGFVLLQARGVESEAELAFSGLGDLLRPVLDLLPEIPQPQAAVLASALAVGPPVRADRFAVCAGTLSLLAAAADRAPVLATLDDAHWLDAASVDALLFAARRLEAERIALLVAVRDGEPSPIGEAGLPELVVGGLDERSSRELLAQAWPEVEPETASRLVGTAAGNPLALLEIPALLTEAQRRGAAALEEPLPAGVSLERVFLKRLAALPKETEWALLVAAAGDSADLGTIEAALGPGGDGRDALEPAERAGLVRFEAGTVEFRHPLVRSAVYHSAAGPDRRAAHAALAEALVGRSEERRAWHLAAAATAPDEEVASALALAARRASERSGYAAAASAQERAAALTPDARRRAERMLDAARSLELAGRFERALAVLDVALREAGDHRLLRADIQHVRGRIEMVCGRPAAARELFLSEAEAVAALDPARAAAMLVEAAMLEFSTESKEEALATVQRAYALAEGTPTERWARIVLEALEATWRLPSDGVAAAVVELPVDGEELAQPALFVTIVHALLHLGEHERAERLATRYVERARSLGAVGALPEALLAQAITESDPKAAYAHALEAAELATETGQLLPLANSLMFLGYLASRRGREEEARASFDRAGEIMRETGWGDDVLVDYGYARMALALGRPDEAIRRLEPVCFDDRGELRYRSAWAVDLVDAYVKTGRLEDARVTLAKMERRAWPEGTFRLGVQACRGLVASEDEFERHFVEALAGNDRADSFGRARAELWFGQRLRRARQRTEARKWLRLAIEHFEAEEATAWADQARAELAATGETTRRSSPELNDLTPQELKVALAVAEGATNKEAAARLFLSPKTVEFHLGKVYRKLGVRSRTELARQLTPTSP
jgi:DNA-binding NarL/FixJ family response regulator